MNTEETAQETTEEKEEGLPERLAFHTQWLRDDRLQEVAGRPDSEGVTIMGDGDGKIVMYRKHKRWHVESLMQVDALKKVLAQKLGVVGDIFIVAPEKEADKDGDDAADRSD